MTSASFDLQRVQLIRKWAAGVCLLLVTGLALITTSYWGDGSFHETFEQVGMAAIVVSIVGRAWCTLYIGGRKKAEIVDLGPYSVSRNPLYLFSYIGIFGVGAQTGSMVLALLFLLGAMVVFHFTIVREEAWLREAFGQPYIDYCSRTPRLGPDFSKWRDVETIEVRPELFLTTIRDGMVFLLAWPIFEGIEIAQQHGWLPLLLRLP